MKVFLDIINSKLFLYIILALFVASIFFIFVLNNKNEKLETYNRQLSGQLTEKERLLQSSNYEIGVLNSQLLSQSDLYKNLKSEKEEVDRNFEKFVKEYNLQIVSKDKVIAQLRQQIDGGNTTVIINNQDFNCKNIENCQISYSWSDLSNRFQLKDPNIFVKNDELFLTNQLFKVYGEIWQQEDGSLQIKRLVLREVYKDGDQYKDVENGKAQLVDSSFEYYNPPKLDVEFNWKDLFNLRFVAIGSTTVYDDYGLFRLGLGIEFFNFKGFGINSHTAFDFTSVEHIEQRLGISYTPYFWNLNFGIGLSVGTPYYNMFREYSLNIDLIFYLNN